MKRITTRAVDILKRGETLWDADIKGFGVRYRTAGKSFFLKTRVSGTQRWFTIGRYGSPWTAETARRQALRLLGAIANGEDPASLRDESKHNVTMSELCDLYLKEGCARKKRSTIATDSGRIERHIKPLLGKQNVRTISKRDIERFMRDVADGKTATDVKTIKQGRAIVAGGKGTATRTVGLLGGIFSFAQDRGLVESNPVRGIKRFVDKKVERYLSEDEMARLGGAISELEESKRLTPFAAAAIRLLLLTGARRGEVLTMRWEWVDFDRRFIFLPDSKTGQKPLYLSVPAIEVLINLPHIEKNPFVICGQKEGHYLVNIKKSWNRVCELASIENLRIHDLRHNFASIGAMGGLSLPIIGKLLGHKKTETTARYSHLADDPVRVGNEQIGQKISKSLKLNENRS